MKTVLIVCALTIIVAVAGKPATTEIILTTAGLPAYYTSHISQYHSQDELGQYAYGYNGDLSTKAETRTLDGITRGTYSYLDAEGKIQTVEYTADSINGFRAAATNLPKAPIDLLVAPEPVHDTVEVIEARANHLAQFEEIAKRNEMLAVEEEQQNKIEMLNVEAKSLVNSVESTEKMTTGDDAEKIMNPLKLNEIKTIFPEGLIALRTADGIPTTFAHIISPATSGYAYSTPFVDAHQYGYVIHHGYPSEYLGRSAIPIEVHQPNPIQQLNVVEAAKV